MKSKNKNLFLKIYIPFVIITIITLIVLQILGSKKRIGYLTDFNLEIDRTLELNNSTNFVIDGGLEESIKNYLLTNENITNYVYHFRIRYYDKVFRNNDIYGVYVDLSNLPDYMENAEMEAGGSPYGNFISDRKNIEEERIDNVSYRLSIKSNFIIILMAITLSIFMVYFIIKHIDKIITIFIVKNIHKEYYKPLSKTEIKFIIINIIVGLILFIFHFWLGFPGCFQYWDIYDVMKQAIENYYGNWHPVLTPLTLHFLYKIFGIHSYYLFLINLILFYLGLVLIIISLFYKFKTKKVTLIYLLIFIKDIYFMNFSQMKDFTASMFVWLLYSLIFFQLMMPINNKYIRISIKIFTGIILLFGLLWRHNFIVTIYPIFILITYFLLKNKEIKSIKNYIKQFAILMLLWAVILVGIVKIFPHIWGIHSNYASNHLILLQIAACSVPANDGALIPNEWYENGRTFEDVKKTYNDNPLNADNFTVGWQKNAPFPHGVELPHLKKVWIKYILKYPINYIKHINRFFIEFCIKNNKNRWIMNSNSIQELRYFKYSDNYIWNDIVIDKFSANEQKITFTPLRHKIYDFLFNNTIHIPIIFPVVISFMIFIISFILIFIKRIFDNDILIYSFSVSFSAIATILIVVSFTPIIDMRYIYPIYPISIISLISFLTFIKDFKRGGKK